MKKDFNQLDARSQISTESNKILDFLLRNKATLFFIILLIVVVVWALIKINVMEHRFTKEKEALTYAYELQIDSLTVSHLELTSKVFSWGIRSEMMHQNQEQINQFFLNYIKETDVICLSLIDPQTNMIILSTDKTQEGRILSLVDLSQDGTVSIVEDSVFSVVTSIMGLNSKIGILKIDYPR